MKRCLRHVVLSISVLLIGSGLPLPGLAQAGANAVYRCPGPSVLYTDALSAEEARSRGCRTIEGAPITIIQVTKPRAAAGAPPASGNGGAAASRPGDNRIDPQAQRQRDSDARRILENELQREEEKLAALKRDYSNGEPERRGDERNFQKNLDRAALMKSNLVRSESDIAAIRREIAKLGAP